MLLGLEVLVAEPVALLEKEALREPVALLLGVLLAEREPVGDTEGVAEREAEMEPVRERVGLGEGVASWLPEAERLRLALGVPEPVPVALRVPEAVREEVALQLLPRGRGGS